jgi:hypothetical protein
MASTFHVDVRVLKRTGACSRAKKIDRLENVRRQKSEVEHCRRVEVARWLKRLFISCSVIQILSPTTEKREDGLRRCRRCKLSDEERRRVDAQGSERMSR